MGKLRDLQTQLATKIDATLHGIEAGLKKSGGAVGRLDVVIEGLRDAILGGTSNRAAQAPYLRDAIGMQRYMIMPIVVCIPLLLFAIYLYGWRAIAVVAVSYIFGVLAALAFVVVRRHEITEGVLVTCILFAVILPPSIPLWMVAVGIVFAVVVGKEIFGGTGYNIFNVAVTGRAFLLIAFPVELTTRWYKPLFFSADGGSSVWGGFAHWMPFIVPQAERTVDTIDALTTATPLQLMKFESVSTDFWDMFLGVRAGSLGESSVLLLLLGLGLLLVTRIVDWRLAVAMMLSVGFFGQLFNMMFPDVFHGDGLFMMMAGGALFAAVLHITDPVTSCMSTRGKLMLAILVGLLTVLIRNLTGYNEGVTFAILIGNMFVPLIDRFTIPKSFAGRART